MSFNSRLRHVVAIERAAAGAADEYNTPAQTYAPLTIVNALIQPKSGRELALVNNGGPVRGEYRIYMGMTDVVEADHLIRQEPPEVYEITFVADAGGVGHHLELDANKVWP